MTPREIIEASTDIEFIKRIPYITIGELNETEKLITRRFKKNDIDIKHFEYVLLERGFKIIIHYKNKNLVDNRTNERMILRFVLDIKEEYNCDYKSSDEDIWDPRSKPGCPRDD
jgi:hypothetical protein